MDEKFGLIYSAVDKINGKMYIGQTTRSLEERKKDHLNFYKTSNQEFHKAIVKFGFNNFEWSILEDKIPQNRLIEKEIYYIALYNTYHNGYNMNIGGSGLHGVFGENNPLYGIQLSDERKLHLSKIKIQFYKNHPEKKLIGEKNPMFGKTHTDETKEKISKAISGENNGFYGKHHSKETIMKIKEKLNNLFLGEKNPMFGKTHTDEAKEKMSLSHKKYWTEEKRKLFSDQKKSLYKNHPERNPMFGKKHSNETRKLMSLKKKGRKSMYKDGIYKMIIKEEIENYLKNGWVLKGRKKSKINPSKLLKENK